MKTGIKRICIYPKDIQLITGKSYRQSLRIAQEIKSALNKDKEELITVSDFSEYTGIAYEEFEHLIFD